MKVLFLTHRVPYAPNRGDRIRGFHIVQRLSEHLDLELLSLAHDREELARAEDLSRLGVRAKVFLVPRVRNLFRAAVSLAGTTPLTHTLLDAPELRAALDDCVRERRPDVVLSYCSGMMPLAVAPPLATCPTVLDLVDVDSQKWAALAADASWPKRWIYRREAEYLARFEREAVRLAHTTLVVNDRERDTLRRIAPEASVQVVRNGFDATALEPRMPPTDQPHVVFCGVMNYQPNIDGMRWFVRSVWPQIRERYQNATLWIVGSAPTSAIRRLNSSELGINVTGTVPDVAPYLWDAAVSVAPLTVARGVQNKVLEAVAAGLPVVVTSGVFEGLPDEVKPACRVADSAERFAAETIRLLALRGSERRALARRADLHHLTWEPELSRLIDVLEDAASSGRPATATTTSARRAR